MAQPIVKSRRQHLRLWFEFYKLACNDPELEGNLRKVRAFYEPWGNPRGVRFDDWWKDHAYLFGATRVEEITRVSKRPSVLNVAIPLNISASQSIAQIKEMIEGKQRARLDELGIDAKNSKSLSAGFGKYEINAKELRGRPLHEALLVFQIWIELGRPTINSAFLQSLRERLLSRPRAKWLPSFLLTDATPDRRGKLQFSDEQIRQTRRSLKKAQQVCLAVSKGRFPE